MTRTRLWVRGLLLACVLALGLIAAGRASALSNGDACSPFWTEADPPTAAFGVSPATVPTRELVALDATPSRSGTADKWTFVSGDSMCEPTSTTADPIASYTWNFGDGSPPETDPLSAPFTGHTYATPGTYSITLTVTERNCQGGPATHCFNNQATHSVTVQNRSPVASFTAPTSVATGRLASFDASGSEDFDGHVTGYHWDFGDGQSQDSVGPQTVHTYNRSGPKTVTLTVTDDNGATGQSQRAVAVTDRPPSASFTAPVAIGKGQAASFDASGSFDPDGAISSYRWDFGDGQVRMTATPRVAHAYTQQGPKTVSLVVSDDAGGTDHTERTLTVTAGLPSASFSAAPATIVGHPVTFDASASSDPDGTLTGFRWDFGDGQTLTTAAPAVSHTYHTIGTMTVTLTITDDNGGGAVTRGTIKVLARGCVVPRLLGKKLRGARLALKGRRLSPRDDQAQARRAAKARAGNQAVTQDRREQAGGRGRGSHGRQVVADTNRKERKMGRQTHSRGPSRRDFLKGLGATGAGLVAGSTSAAAGLVSSPGEAAARPVAPGRYARGHGAPASSVEFGRIFPALSPFAEANDTVRAALLEVGKPGGIMDARDQLSAGPKALIVDPAVNGNPTASNPYGTNPDNPTMTAGSTFVGQFTDHDITFDQTSTLGVPQNPLISPNTRTPALDLDSVFGGGPGRRPDLYVPNADGTVGPKLKLGTGGVHEDVPRVPNGDGTYSALLGDPRNDENLIIAGLHCAHILFYNRVLDELSEFDLSRFPAARRGDRRGRYMRFLLAREVTLWHYQWLLVNEHLPQIAGQAMVNHVLRHGNRFYRPPGRDAFMPIEFGAAAYRFGHSMIRPSYRANFTSGTGDSVNPTANPFFALVFDPNEPDFSAAVAHDRADLLGGYPAPRRYIGWQTFFDLGDGQVKNNKKIDPTISSVLFTLPLPAIAPHTQTAPTVLPQRNLLRQLTWGMPSGQAIARAIGVPTLSRAELSDIGAIFAPFARHTPLWYYALAEAKALAGGLHLGPVGGRIVTETLIGLLRADPTSYLSAHPRFRPFLGTDLKLGPTPNPNITGDRSYTHAHFLHYARVVNPGTYR